MKIKFKDIRIEHLAYTVKVRDIKKEENLNKWVMFVRKINNYECILYIPKELSIEDMPTLAHEIVHCLQYIAEARNIDMIQEQEHIGYLMCYIMNNVLGFRYAKNQII